MKKATCRKGCSLNGNTVGLSGTEFAKVSACTVLLQAAVPRHLPAVYRCERIQAQFVKKLLSVYFYMHVSQQLCQCSCTWEYGEAYLSLLNFSMKPNPKPNTQTNKKKRDMTRKAAVPLNAPFHNAVLYFASLGLPLGKKINKIHSAIHFLFFPHCTETAATSELVENFVQPNNNNKRKNRFDTAQWNVNSRS